MVLRDLPLAILEYINKGVPTLDLSAGGTHGEFIDASVLGPVRTDENIPTFNLSWQIYECSRRKEKCELSEIASKSVLKVEDRQDVPTLPWGFSFKNLVK